MVEPIKILRQDISPVEVGKYYLKVEFSRIFPEETVRESLDARIDGWDETTLWSMLEAISATYRLNSVFWYVSDSKYLWHEERWRAADLTLTGMGPHVDKVTHSQEVGRDPIKFRNFLRSYLEQHPHDDPFKLAQFRVDERPVRYDKIMLREKDGEARLLDGSNRLMKLVMMGQDEIVALRAVDQGGPNRPRYGNSTFRLLRTAYAQADEAGQAAIMDAAEQLARQSSDGEAAIKSYWVEHIRDEAERQPGLELLRRLGAE
jgi:hypothetical protein